MRERRRRRSSEQLIVGVEHVGPEHLMGSAFEKTAERRIDALAERTPPMDQSRLMGF